MVLTDSLVAVADAVIGVLEASQDELGYEDIFYGDQELIPRNPAICIETGEKTRVLNGAPRRTEVTLPVYLLIYHNALSNTIVQRRDNDELAEAIEAKLHENEDLGGIVVHSMVTSLEPGYQVRSGTIYRVTRITFEATSQTQLPFSAL